MWVRGEQNESGGRGRESKAISTENLPLRTLGACGHHSGEHCPQRHRRDWTSGGGALSISFQDCFRRAWATLLRLLPGLIACGFIVVHRASQVANAGDARGGDLIPWSRRSPGEGNGNPLQYSCLENSVDRGAWQATVHGSAKN